MVTGDERGHVPGRPLPVPDPLTQPFWDAAQEGRLVIQRCPRCRTYQHPPKHSCPICGHPGLNYEQVSGLGRVYSFTLVHDTRVKSFEAVLPYNVVLVELEEQSGLMLVVNMPTTAYKNLGVDVRVEVMFLNIGAGLTLPEFRLTSER